MISFRLIAVAAVVMAALVTSAAADPPDILRNYRFVTSHSTVHVSGGLPGYNMDLSIDGRFGVVTGYDYSVDPTAHIPTLVPHAEFVDVKAILFNPLSLAPLPVPGWDLDKTLNLTGLAGTFQTGDSSRLYFQGVDGQGAPIKLEAAVRDPLIHIVGANDPRCAACGRDLIGYTIDAYGILPKQVDYNADGIVDAADYVMWRKTPTTSVMTDNGSQIEIEPGDFFDLWRAEFGQLESGGSSAATALSSGSAVPEPTTFTLVLVGVFMLARWRIRP